jgi:hypothetical protein
VLLGGDAFHELGGHLEAGVLGAPVVQNPLGVACVAPGVRVVNCGHRLGRTRRAKYQRVSARVARVDVLSDDSENCPRLRSCEPRIPAARIIRQY